jgi:predicted nucleic acid-binding protein
MILVDTNIIIDFLRGNTEALTAANEADELASCGVVLTELLHGAKSDNEINLIVEAINNFAWVPIKDHTWHRAGLYLKLLAGKGLTVPFQDALLSAVCTENNIPLFSKDTHFKEIAKLILELKLYNK